MMNARLEELRTKFQENPRRYFAPFANELRKAGDSAQAISVCRAHLAGQPGHVSGHIVLGQALYEAGEATEARDIFSAALELDPENLIALRSLGEIAQVNGEFGMARQWYERLLDADPRNTEVEQLLRDIPAEPASRSGADLAASESATTLSEALPDGAKAEPEPVPVSSFHTTFTGSGPAYRPAEDEPADEPARAEFVDLEPATQTDSVEFKAHLGHLPAASAADTESSESAPADSPDLIESEAFPSAPSMVEAQAEPTMADESYGAPAAQEAGHSVEMNFELSTPDVAPEVEGDIHQTASETEVETETPDGTTRPTAAEEPRCALFAEHGFEGAVDDQLGWMTTSSAALSDPEAAPENWFEEPEASEEAPAAEMMVPEPSRDSWFEDVTGAAVIESTDVSSEEFWLPPELPQFPTSVEAAPPDHADIQEEVVRSAGSDHDTGVVPISSAEAQVEEVGFESLSVEAVDGSSDYDTTSSAPDNPAAATSPKTAEMAPWSRPVEPEPVEAARWPEPAESEIAGPPRLLEHEAADSAAESGDLRAADGIPETPEPVQSVMGRTPGFLEAVPPPTPAPFVTETLAELYLQQGFRSEALAIYRQLAERNPADEHLRKRIQGIEQRDVTDVLQKPDVEVDTRAGSQSVRTFFSRLARRTAAPGTEAAPHQSESGGTNSEVPFAAAASALANLFAASKPPASDESAASTLSGAFTDPSGRPSRAADRELSLDHLFRDVPSGRSASGGVSLDEFFATPIGPPGSPTEHGEAEGAPEPGGTDIRQFTAWLEGLRKK